MDRRRPRALAAATWALALAAAWGVAPARAGTVVVLRSRPLAPYDSVASGFRAGYHGAVVERTLPDSGAESVVDELLGLRPDAVVAIGPRAALLARDRMPRTPIVYCTVPDPQRYELEGAWITGVSAEVPPELELDALIRAAPDVRRVGLIVGAGRRDGFVPRARAAAARAGLVLVEAPLSDAGSLAARAREIVDRVDALWMPADATAATPESFRFVLDLSLTRGKPLLAFAASLVRAGALVAVCPDYVWIGARAADQVRRIQAGERAGDVPVAALRRTRLVLNLATARALGREIPPATVASAEVVP
ncbi:MAG TPA: ABC transporter substrate binding protein [Candidatus Eisenbacteria bacterium]|jgi:putative ABC transport system substrate-binding protein